MTRHLTPDRLLGEAATTAGAASTAALHALEIIASAAIVIGLRAAMIAGPRGLDHREMRLMVSEKLRAAGQCAGHAASGWQRMHVQILEAWLGQAELAMRFGATGWGVATGPESLWKYQEELLGMWSAAAATPLALAATASRNTTSTLAPYRTRTARNVKRLVAKRR